MLDTLVPRLRASARIHSRAGGSVALADLETGTFVELAADQAAIVALFDGQRTIADVVAAHFARHAAFSFQALGDLLSRLRQVGLLENPTAELEAAGVKALKPPSLMQRIATARLGRWRLPLLGGVSIGLFAAVVGWSVVWLLKPAAPGVGIDPLLPGHSALGGLVGVLVGASLALTLRSTARAAVGRLSGARPAALELRRFVLLPIVVIEEGQVLTLDRWPRIAAHLTALATPWLFAAACAAAARTAPERALMASLALGAAIVGFFDAIAFAPTSLGKTLAALAGRVDLLDHARAYVTRRFVSRVASKGLFEGELGMMVSSLLSILWVGAMIRVVGKYATPQPARLIQAALLGRGAERIAAWVAAALVLAAMLVALIEVVMIFVFATRSAAPGLFRPAVGKGTREQVAPADAVEALRRVPVFAGLGPEPLADVAKEAVFDGYEPEAVIVRQGDPGDRFVAIVSGRVEVLVDLPSGLQQAVATLGPGDCFGETALLEDSPRTASVRALEPLRVLSISRTGFQKLSAELQGVDLTRALRASAALRRSALARALPAERIAEIVPRLTARTVEAGEVICRLGDPGDNFYVIDAGQVEVLGPGDAPMATLGAGDSFGETALLIETPRTATVRARERTSLWALSRLGLYAVLSRNAALSQTLTETVAKHAEARKAG